MGSSYVPVSDKIMEELKAERLLPVEGSSTYWSTVSGTPHTSKRISEKN